MGSCFSDCCDEGGPPPNFELSPPDHSSFRKVAGWDQSQQQIVDASGGTIDPKTLQLPTRHQNPSNSTFLSFPPSQANKPIVSVRYQLEKNTANQPHRLIILILPFICLLRYAFLPQRNHSELLLCEQSTLLASAKTTLTTTSSRRKKESNPRSNQFDNTPKNSGQSTPYYLLYCLLYYEIKPTHIIVHRHKSSYHIIIIIIIHRRNSGIGRGGKHTNKLKRTKVVLSF